jgi:AraC-like DNA-binding protein
MPAGVALRSAAGLIESAASLGCNKETLWALLGVTPASISNPDQMIDATKVYELWEAVFTQTKDPEIAIKISSFRRTPPSDPFGFLFMTSPNIQDALEMSFRYLHLRATTATYRMEEPDDKTVKVIQDRSGADCIGLRLAVESTTSDMALRLRELIIEEIFPQKITFTHAPLGQHDLHERVLGGPVSFRATENAIWLPKRILSIPLRHGNPSLASYFRTQVETALSQRQDSGKDLTSEIRRRLASDLARVPSLEKMAQELGLGERTLRRRLEEERTSFQEILDDLRVEVARRHLQQQRISISEVAYLLGYSEPSAFHRAFKRWTGQTPAEFRAEALGARSEPL